MTNHRKKCAPCCDDQLPVFAVVGRGPKGDSSHVGVGTPDSCTETYVEGYNVDEVTGETIIGSEWRTENINGGELSYQYNLRPYSNPRTFTITFIYRRPGRHEWSWTTPAIPYIWTIDNGDGTVSENPDHIIGSGIATLFVKTVHDNEWNERLHYPLDPDTGEPYPREYFNAPEAEEAWSSTITFGYGGDIEIPDLDDLAKIIGISREEIEKWLQSKDIIINEIDARNIVDYINKCDDAIMDHLHEDLGFCDKDHEGAAFGGYYNVKDYIDAKFEELNVKIDEKIDNILGNLAEIIYGASLDDEGNIVIPDNTKIPTGNINVFSGGTTAYIRTRSGEKDNDLKGM